MALSDCAPRAAEENRPSGAINRLPGTTINLHCVGEAPSALTDAARDAARCLVIYSMYVCDPGGLFATRQQRWRSSQWIKCPRWVEPADILVFLDEGETAQLAVYVVLYGTAVHLVREGAVTAARLQQHANDVGVSVFAGTHQGRGALSVLCVYIRTAA